MRYYTYDKDTMLYTGMAFEKPEDGFFTEVEPSDSNVFDVWYLRVYQPETDDWRDWAPSEYEKYSQPSEDELFKMEILSQLAELSIKMEDSNV